MGNHAPGHKCHFGIYWRCLTRPGAVYACYECGRLFRSMRG